MLRRRSPFTSTRKRFLRPLVLVPLALLVVLAAAVPAAMAAARNGVEITGVKDGAVVGAAKMAALTLHVASDKKGQPTVTMDGKPVQLQPAAKGYDVRPTGLADGKHQISVTSKGSFPFGSSTVSRSFTVDTTPPTLDIVAPPQAPALNAPVTVTGKVEAGSTLTVDGKKVPVTDGAFSMKFDAPPAAAHFVAVDAAGNETAKDVSVPVRYPSNVRAVHVTSLAWQADALRNPVLELIKAKKIDAVELDVKDEDGIVGYDSQVPLAREIKATEKNYDLKATTDQLHAMNVRVIGRIVVFRDGMLAKAAVAAGKRDQVVQQPDGQPYKGYGGFTNIANPVVQQYNIDLAVEARKGGMDDILYDYVRRPDGPIKSMVFPGIQGTPEDQIVKFMADSRKQLWPLGAFVGASVFGVAATRPTEVAQDVPRMAQVTDFIAPMLYPSHWAKNEYNVANPNSQPYDIVRRSLDDFNKDVKGTDAAVVPWLQDFSLGVTYGPAEVAAQIKATQDAGINGFLLWNAGAKYTGNALTAVP
ncbi:MAG: hypothetical protein NVSMB13_01970 [Mycobacteriales bacterium]